MRCPSLDQLPPPPPGKVGWPWTIESRRVPDTLSDGSLRPRITIVTPSYNQGEFIEETMRSVLLQGYPDLEYIVMDGGSTDDSVERIKRYEQWVDYVSALDDGQAAAINSGLCRATGEILQWINSDDLLAPNALAEVASLCEAHPTAIIAGSCQHFWPSGRKIVNQNQALTREGLITFWKRKATFQQPSVFVPAIAVRACGLLDESLRYCFDFDWMIRLLASFPVVYTNCTLSFFRWHPRSKSYGEREKLIAELGQVSARYWDEVERVRAAKEFAAYLPREAWLMFLDRTLESDANKREKLWNIFVGTCKALRRSTRRETWGTVRRILS